MDVSPSPRSGQGFSASLRYQQSLGSSNLALDGPLGIGGLRVELDGEDISIATSRGEKLDGEAARAELERRLGFALPLAELRWWLLGIPAPGEATRQPGCRHRRNPRFHAEWLARQHQFARGRPRVLAAATAHRRTRGRAPETAGRPGSDTLSTHALGPAPAKLNLMLHVVGRRADGYHELQTVFQLIDLCDRIEIRVRDDGAITRPKGPVGVPNPRIWWSGRPGRSRRQYRDTGLGAEISMKKSIPLGGGLGGGSSDAATTLVALNADVANRTHFGADRGNWRQVGR